MDVTRPENRRQDIVDQATRLFGANGFSGTSIRDIAAAVGMLPGSVYYHFPSKTALLATIYADVIDRSVDALEAAVAIEQNPWDRLEAAAATHLRLLLAGGMLAAVVVDGRSQPTAARPELILARDRYEAVFRRLIADVTLPPGVLSGPFRHALLGALNWTLTWYRPGGDPPETVARNLFAIFRAGQPMETTP